jgi:hypothetical protein
LGHRAIGFDVDPLAVLMARVWTTPVSDSLIEGLGREVVRRARALTPKNIVLPWIDKDEQNSRFVSYWFGEEQRNGLRRLALILSLLNLSETETRRRNALDVLRVAFSRIIITKDRGASLARDVSHSRPHKVDEDSDFAVFPAFENSLSVVRQRLLDAPPPGRAVVGIGDARALRRVKKRSVSAVVTSPPYLNAIVLRPEGRATLIVGNSCLKNVFIRNADGVIRAGELCRLKLLQEYERELPAQHRYLPPPEQGTLGKRMRTETILTFSLA